MSTDKLEAPAAVPTPNPPNPSTVVEQLPSVAKTHPPVSWTRPTRVPYLAVSPNGEHLVRDRNDYENHEYEPISNHFDHIDCVCVVCSYVLEDYRSKTNPTCDNNFCDCSYGRLSHLTMSLDLAHFQALGRHACRYAHEGSVTKWPHGFRFPTKRWLYDESSVYKTSLTMPAHISDANRITALKIIESAKHMPSHAPVGDWTSGLLDTSRWILSDNITPDPLGRDGIWCVPIPNSSEHYVIEDSSELCPPPAAKFNAMGSVGHMLTRILFEDDPKETTFSDIVSTPSIKGMVVHPTVEVSGTCSLVYSYLITAYDKLGVPIPDPILDIMERYPNADIPASKAGVVSYVDDFLFGNKIAMEYGVVHYPTFGKRNFYKDPLTYEELQTPGIEKYILTQTNGKSQGRFVCGQINVLNGLVLPLSIFKRLPVLVKEALAELVSTQPFAIVIDNLDSTDTTVSLWRRLRSRVISLSSLSLANITIVQINDYLLDESLANAATDACRVALFGTSALCMVQQGTHSINVTLLLASLASHYASTQNRYLFGAIKKKYAFHFGHTISNNIAANADLLVHVGLLTVSLVSSSKREENESFSSAIANNMSSIGTIAAIVGTCGLAADMRVLKDISVTIRAFKTVYQTIRELTESTIDVFFKETDPFPPYPHPMTRSQADKLAPLLLVDPIELYLSSSDKTSSNKMLGRYIKMRDMCAKYPIVRRLLPVIDLARSAVSDNTMATVCVLLGLMILIAEIARRVLKRVPTKKELKEAMNTVSAPLVCMNGTPRYGTIKSLNGKLHFVDEFGKTEKLYRYDPANKHSFMPATNVNDDPVLFVPTGLTSDPTTRYNAYVNTFVVTRCKVSRTEARRPRPFHVKYKNRGGYQEDADVIANDFGYTGPRTFEDLAGTKFDSLADYMDAYDIVRTYEKESATPVEPWFTDKPYPTLAQSYVAKHVYKFTKEELNDVKLNFPLWWSTMCYMVAANFRAEEALGRPLSRRASVKPVQQRGRASPPTKEAKKTSSYNKKGRPESNGDHQSDSESDEELESATSNVPIPIHLFSTSILPIFIGDAFLGTGFMCGNKFITAEHVFRNGTDNYQTLTTSGPLRLTLSYASGSVLGPDIIAFDLPKSAPITTRLKPGLKKTSGGCSVVGYYCSPGQRPHLKTSQGTYKFQLHDCHTIPGVSGSPIFNTAHEVIGVHAASTGDGEFPNRMNPFTEIMVTKLTQGNLTETVQTMSTLVEVSQFEDSTHSGYEAFYDAEHVPIKVIGRTQLKSTFGDKPVICPRFASFMHESGQDFELSHTRSSRDLEAEGKAIMKFHLVLPDVPPSPTFEKAFDIADMVFSQAMAGSRVLTTDEAIEEMKNDSSPGGFLKGYKDAKTYVTKNRDHLDAYINSIEATAHAPLVAFTGSLKDELRSIDKVTDKKTRLFMAAPKHHYIAHSKLTWEQNKRMVAYGKKTETFPSAIGHSPIPLVGYIGRLSQEYDQTLCSDFGGFDAHLNPYFFSRVLRFRWNCIAPDYQTTENRNALINVYRNVIWTPTICPNGCVALFDHGPSGHACTSYDNTYILFGLIMWFFLTAGGTSDPRAILTGLRLFLYGDDSVIMTNGSFSSLLTKEHIIKCCSAIGWEVEFSDNVEFLGHTAVHSDRFNNIVAYYDSDKLISSLAHTTTKNVDDLSNKVTSLYIEAFSDLDTACLVKSYAMWLNLNHGVPYRLHGDAFLWSYYMEDPYISADPKWNDLESTIYEQSMSTGKPTQGPPRGRRPRTKPNPNRSSNSTAPPPPAAKKRQPRQAVPKSIQTARQVTRKQALRAQHNALLADRYANCLLDPVKYHCRIPDSYTSSSSEIVSNRVFDVTVPTTGPAAGRLCIMVQPKLGAPDQPDHYSVGIVDYTDGEPMDLSSPTAWQNNKNLSLSVDPTAVSLTTADPSFVFMSSGSIATDADRFLRPLGNIENVQNQVTTTGPLLTYDAVVVEEAGSKTIDGVVRQGSLLSITPGTYVGTIRMNTATSTLDNAIPLINMMVFRGSATDPDQGSVIPIEFTGRNRSVAYMQFILSVTPSDRLFVWCNPDSMTAPPAVPGLRDTLLTMSPAAVPAVTWNPDLGVVDKVRPVACTMLFTPTLSQLQVNGQIIIGRVPSGNLRSQLLCNTSTKRLDSIAAFSAIGAENYTNQALAKGGFTWYAPSGQEDMNFKTVEESNQRDFPFLLMVGKINSLPVSEAPVIVGKLVVSFNYEFVHSSQLFPLKKAGGGLSAQNALQDMMEVPIASHNPSHGDLARSIGKVAGSVLDIFGSIF